MKKNADSPTISVVMLNYNGLNYLLRTVHPILELDYPNYEFIIVDNGSTDGSLEFIKKFERIRLIQSPRLREKNFACNYSINMAKGDYILLLDNDVFLTTNNILKELLNNSKNLRYFGSLSLGFVNENEKESSYYGGFFNYFFIKHNQTPISIEEFKKLHNNLIGFPHGAALFIKKETWLLTEGYDDHLMFGGDDTDLGMRLWLLGYRNYLFSKSIQIHIGKKSNEDTNYYNFKLKNMYYAHLYTIIKNYSLLNTIIILIVYSFFAFIKSIKQSIFRLHIGSFIAFFQGYYLFIKNFPTAIRKRKEIQSKRDIKEDIFLKIKPQDID